LVKRRRNWAAPFTTLTRISRAKQRQARRVANHKEDKSETAPWGTTGRFL
jgi:hypothetical protein